MALLIFLLVIVAVLGIVAIAMAVKVVKQYEKGVLFRFGRLVGTRSPGLKTSIEYAGQ
ncbi:hypothetical protein [Streptomyces sp. NBC_01477]|uniref:hypothetical protein n=1 Tax=Streptomyces sp. NBC_01477 TaxID=2976015 RepID=UPI002E3345A6|nr:hypothetical protein [Streptomyces sp. NBC_01477]